MSALANVADDASGESPASRVKVLIADDHPLIIAGIRRTIEHLDDMEVVGEAHSGPELIQLIERRRPDVVLMDLRMPGGRRRRGDRAIRERWPAVKTIVLSACDDRPTIDAALHAGRAPTCSRAPTPSISPRCCARRPAVRSSTPRPAPRRARPIATSRRLPSLTDRERSILSAVASGMTTAAISRDLWISEHTIKFHLTNIYRKLGVANRAGAVRYALEHGIA